MCVPGEIIVAFLFPPARLDYVYGSMYNSILSFVSIVASQFSKKMAVPEMQLDRYSRLVYFIVMYVNTSFSFIFIMNLSIY
jgi:hypothetical protein